MHSSHTESPELLSAPRHRRLWSYKLVAGFPVLSATRSGFLEESRHRLPGTKLPTITNTPTLTLIGSNEAYSHRIVLNVQSEIAIGGDLREKNKRSACDVTRTIPCMNVFARVET
jgi:hypothetical protein